MAGKTVTRADLAESVFRKVGLSRTESAELVETVIDEICNAIVRGETVKLSSFATFQVRDKNERIGRNPKSGEQVLVPGKQVPHFKAGKELRERVDLVGGNDEDAQSSGSSEPMPSMASMHAMH